MSLFRKAALIHKGLRYKLLLAFSLMSIIPLLACTYVISLYVFPQLDVMGNASLVIFASVMVALLGLILAKTLVDPVIGMALEARIIASGQYDRSVHASSDDEVGNLAESINVMTQKIKTNLDELKSYGQKMKEINTDVHKKVLALSSLLQIGDIISSGSIQLDGLLDMAVEKTAMLFDSGFCMLYLSKDDESDFILKAQSGQDADRLKDIAIKRRGRGLLDRSVEARSILVLDSSVKMSKEMESFRSECQVSNILAIPVYSGRKNFGLLVIGSTVDDYKYKNEDIELVKVFAKQVTIAIENDILNKKTEELSIKDDLTDLYNKSFILNRLGEEIKRAIFYQRPCSFAIFGIDDFAGFRKAHGEIAAEEALKRMAKLIKDNMIPVGKAARIAGDEFAVLLPEKNKKESFTIAEDIRKKIEGANFLKTGNASLTVSGGVSENPLDGATSDELLAKAEALLKEAKSSGKNRVIL